jgi:hypothetical protein
MGGVLIASGGSRPHNPRNETENEMKKIGLLLAMAACLPLVGCMGVASPAIGTLFTDVKWDGMAKGALGSKEGKACAHSYFALIATGDASIAAAAAAGGIKDVASVDHTSQNTLGLIGEYCTIVRGS